MKLFTVFAILVLFFLSLVAAGSTMTTSAMEPKSSHHGKHEMTAEEKAHHEGRMKQRAEREALYHRQDYANEAVDVTSDSLSSDDDDQEVERDCGFFDHWELRKTLAHVVCGKKESDCGSGAFPGGAVGSAPNGGFGLNVWLSVVNRAGRICAVIHSGDKFDDQWTHSRVISAQKAATANGFSLDEYALSTANLQQATRSGGSLFGLMDANNANPQQAFAGSIKNWGESCTSDDDDDHDPLCGLRLGGTTTFGGGVALYNKHGDKVGAIGVSGETACADHVIAWRVRHELELDYVPNGPNAQSDRFSFGGLFGHSSCGISNEVAVINSLPATRQ